MALVTMRVMTPRPAVGGRYRNRAELFAPDGRRWFQGAGGEEPIIACSL